MDVKHGLTDVEYVCELPVFCLEGIPKEKVYFTRTLEYIGCSR